MHLKFSTAAGRTASPDPGQILARGARERKWRFRVTGAKRSRGFVRKSRTAESHDGTQIFGARTADWLSKSGKLAAKTMPKTVLFNMRRSEIFSRHCVNALSGVTARSIRFFACGKYTGVTTQAPTPLY